MREDSGEDKRSSPRINKRFVLRAAVFGAEPLRWSHVSIHNLSSSGVFFTYDRPVKVGALMRFKIDFPDRIIECVGRVRRIAGSADQEFPSIGASFEGIGADDKKYIDHFVESFQTP